MVEGPAFHPYLSGARRTCCRSDAADRTVDPRTARRPDRRRPGARGAVRRRGQAVPRVLPGHEAAPRAGRGAAAPARPAGAGRADQRPGPPGHPRGAHPGARAGRGRHHGGGLHAPAGRGGAAVQPRRGDERGADGRPGHPGPRSPRPRARRWWWSAAIGARRAGGPGARGDVRAEADASGVSGDLGTADPEALLAALVAAGAGVRQFTLVRGTLEDLFVSMTGEGFDVRA